MTKPFYGSDAVAPDVARARIDGRIGTRIDSRVAQSPLLVQLTQQAARSQRLRERIEPLLPPALRPLVTAGPLEGDQWCVIVPNSAAAAKLRQLLPALLAELAKPDPAASEADAGAVTEAPLPAIAHIRLRIARQ